MTPDVREVPAPHTPAPSFQRGPHWIALCAAVFTLPLLYVGGSVTTYRVGLAVPDWPQTFGINMFLYDFWNAPFGVRVEHTHRLYGAAVGMATLLLAAWFMAFERRRWMKGLGVLAVAAVIVQGVLGGTRVTQVSTLLAAVHGVVGQAFFGLMVALCVMTDRRWHEHKHDLVDHDRLRVRSLWLLALVVAQIGLGSWLRHFGSPAALAVHGVMALAVWAHAVVLFLRVKRGGTSLSTLFASSLAAAVASSLQILLGIVAMVYLLPFDGIPRQVTFYQAVVRTGHQTNGALMLAATVVLILRTFRLLARSTSGASPDFDRGETRQPNRAAVDWEAVA
jgi:cytochrome c oxidase assembly protein subunit 15